MDYINKAIDAIAKTGNDVSKKAKGATEIAKLKSKVAACEGAIKTAYVEIGKYVYENLREDAPEEIAEKMAVVDAAKEDIAKYKAEVLKLRGIQKCEQCGRDVQKDFAFCPACGNKMPEPVVDVVDEGDATEVDEEIYNECETMEDFGEACAEAVEDVCEECAEAVEEVCEACEEKVDAFTE